jgi:alkaline phosphatase
MYAKHPRNIAQKLLALALTVTAALALTCAKQPQDTADTAAAAAPKYVFLFIGDGMGFAHITATEAYLAASTGTIGNASLSFTDFPTMGLATTYSLNSYITCSAASGTALATGVKTNNRMLAVTPSGKKLRSIAYDLKDAGYKIGIATSVSINHATPAAFYANDTSRANYYAIATQLAPSGFDFFAGSGFIYPKDPKGTEEDVYDQIKQAGYVIVHTPEELEQTPVSQKIVMAQKKEHGSEALVKAIDRSRKSNCDGWTLADFTKTGIDRLTGPQGFFFVIESGQIDWMAHANDAAAMIYEMIDFSKTIELAIDFYEKHPNETLIIVTADHETGGLALEHMEKMITELNGKSEFGWATGGHTGGAVPVFAIGTGSERFGGKMDNTEIPKRIEELMGRR